MSFFPWVTAIDPTLEPTAKNICRFRLANRFSALSGLNSGCVLSALCAVLLWHSICLSSGHGFGAQCHAATDGAEDRPPVIMIVVDDLFDYRRFRNRFGVALQTPNLDRLEARGAVFSNTFCSVAVCNASRSSVFSGLSPLRTKIHQPEPIHFFDTLSVDDTLMMRMRNAGYYVVGTGKVMHASTGEAIPRMLQIHDEFFQATGRLKLAAGRRADIQPANVLSADDKNVAWAAEKLRNWDGQQDPLFLSVGIIRPHAPFIAPQEYFDMYDRSAIRVPGDTEVDLEDVSSFYQMYRLLDAYAKFLQDSDLEKEFIHGYLACTSYADAKVGEILDAIDSNPELADARIILWSDNGYELGDKATWNKFTMWETSSRVPMIVVDPTLPAGKTISSSVSLLDVAPTVLRWAGVPAPESFDGIDLQTTYARRGQLDRRSVLTTTLGSCSIRRRDMRLNVYQDGSLGLYHMKNDLLQRSNLALELGWQTVLESMKEALHEQVRSEGGVIDVEAPWIVGTNGDDALFVIGEQLAIGADGDDTYFVSDGFISELAAAGFDRVYFASTDYDLPRNVECGTTYPYQNNLLGAPVWSVSGNSQANEIRLFGAGQGDVDAGYGDDLIVGRGARDSLHGGNGRDVIYAGGNQDVLRGGQGADQLFGEAGDDDLDGGVGPDRMTGGSGSDRFWFPRDTWQDIVTDFEYEADTIWLPVETPLHGMTLAQIRDRLEQLSATEVLIDDDDGRRMLIQNAKLKQVLNSLERE